MSDDGSLIIICQGPPLCDYEWTEEDPVRCDTCPFCDRLHIADDGTETYIKKMTKQ